MTIREARTEDLPKLREIYNAAKLYMDASGNPNQWPVGYPPEEYLRQDIELSRLYVCKEDDVLCGVFLFAVTDDSTYHYIDGAWKNDEPYGVIHRLASDGTRKGIFRTVLEFCKDRMTEQGVRNLRIDTHEENKTMQHLVEQNGFLECGTIYLENGSPRKAYQMISGSVFTVKS